MHTFRARCVSGAFCPSPPACGGRGRGPRRKAWEGEVGRAADRSLRLPPPHPDPLRPQGRRGGYLGSGICAYPSAFAGATVIESSIPAGDVDRDARHEISVARGEKADHLGLVGGFCHTAQWSAGDLGRLRLLRALLPMRANAFGQGKARGDRVNRDTVWPQLERQLAGEGDDAALRRGIGAAARTR